MCCEDNEFIKELFWVGRRLRAQVQSAFLISGKHPSILKFLTPSKTLFCPDLPDHLKATLAKLVTQGFERLRIVLADASRDGQPWTQ